MPKVVLTIFKIGDEYRALIGVGENAQPGCKGKIVYQDGKEIKGNPMELKTLARDPIRQMKEKAKKWAREQTNPEIRFVHNLDFNPYP